MPEDTSKETEVIETTWTKTAVALVPLSKKATLYHDTHVTTQDRQIKFWNTDTFSDTRTGIRCRVKFKILVIGTNNTVDTSGETVWDEYDAPKASTPYVPDATFTVPSDNLPSYYFDIRSECVIEKHVNGQWVHDDGSTEGPETAKTIDDSVGG